MPELPEVETIVRGLRQPALPVDQVTGCPNQWHGIRGRIIRSTEVLNLRTLAEPDPVEFHHRLSGQTVQTVNRRAKYLIIRLDRDVLIIHLRMSGDLRVEPVSAALQPHDRLVIEFMDETRLAFNDPRKFGRVWLVQDEQKILGRLGPEPLDELLTAEIFHQRLIARHRQLKPLLLDQSFLAGLGNIYTDEALHLARLNPLTNSADLNLQAATDLLHAIRTVLQAGIENNGASIDWVYRGGNFQNTFQVYGQNGKPCPTCQTPVERILVGQRSTHFCPVCQPLPHNHPSQQFRRDKPK